MDSCAKFASTPGFFKGLKRKAAKPKKALWMDKLKSKNQPKEDSDSDTDEDEDHMKMKKIRRSYSTYFSNILTGWVGEEEQALQ